MPEDVAKMKESYTGRYLKDVLGRRSANGRGKRQAAEEGLLATQFDSQNHNFHLHGFVTLSMNALQITT